MKTILFLLLFLGITATVYAQLNLEHTYPSTLASRLIHADDGSTYFYTSTLSGIRTYFFFNNEHQPRQTVTITAPDSLPQPSTAFLSHDLFDNDPDFEILQFWYAGGNTPAYGFLYDDDGALLHAEPFVAKTNFPFFRAYRFDDGTWQLLVDGRIYAIPGYQLLHEITDNASNPFGYKADGLDRKYCYINNAGQFVALNQDFSVFQTSAPLADASCNLSLEVLEQRDLDPDDDFEWMLWQTCAQNPVVTVYSGSDELFSSAMPGQVINQPVVLLPRFVNGIDAPKVFVSNSTANDTRVFDLLSGDVEWNVPEQYAPRRTEPGTTLFSRTFLSASETQHTVFDVHYQPVGTFAKTPGLNASVNDVSRRTFDADSNSVEVIYRYGGAVPYMQVVQPGNTELFTLDSVLTVIVSRLNGLPNKLLARNNVQPNWTKVYDLGTVTTTAPAPAPRFPLLVWPNPVSDRLFLDPQTFPANEADVRITDALGRVMWQQHVSSSEVIEVNALSWPASLYVVHVMSAGKNEQQDGGETVKINASVAFHFNNPMELD